jgi:quercetin dioxygenase-like cupin family protein
MKPLPPIDHLKEIEKNPNAVFILHQKKEYRFPVHKHSKGQLTYVEGGVAYLHAEEKTYVVPVRHYIWIPKGMVHYFQVRHAGTAVRTLYFYTHDDKSDPFYQRMGIYTVNNLLHEMILHTEQWNGMITKASKHFAFLSAIKNILPSLGTHSLPIILPTTQDERLNPVLAYLKNNISEVLTLEIVSSKFNMSWQFLN